MQAKFKPIILGLMMVLPLVSASAQTGTSVDSGRPMLKEVRQEVKERVASTSERIKDRLEDARENFLRIARIRVKNIIDRLEATILREEGIYTRIVSRIEKVKSAGGNTTDSERHISEARTHIGNAKTALTTLKNASTTASQNLVDSNTSTSTTAKNNLRKVKEMALTVEKHIREARNSLVKAITSLKGVSTTRATTTSSSN